jgi:hypothetical protein
MALLRPSSIWRQANPVGAIADFCVVFAQAGKNRWRIAAASAAVTIGLFSVIWQEEVRGPPPRPTVTFITSWPADRTDAEIIASNIENQKRKDRLAAEQAKREEEVRNIYKALGRASGMDVDAIEARAKAERAAEEAARRARLTPQPAAAPSGAAEGE